MFEKLEITRMAQSMAAYAGARMGVIARNVANADTPGYKAQDLAPFAEVYQGKAEMRTTRAGHFSATSSGATPVTVPGTGGASPNGNTVSLEGEMVNAVETRQTQEMALAIYRSTSDVIRASLGRK